MTITWEHLKDTSRVVKWGIEPTRIENSIVASPVKRRDDMYYHRTVTLSGLEADRRYYYTVPGVQDTPVSFVTAPEEKSALFRFFVYGDSCEHHKERKNQHYDIADAMVQAERDGPSLLVISTGDLMTESANAHLSGSRRRGRIGRGFSGSAPA